MCRVWGLGVGSEVQGQGLKTVIEDSGFRVKGFRLLAGVGSRVWILWLKA